MGDETLRFLEEARQLCPRYVRHDTNAHEDDALSAMVEESGMAFYGWYWLLVELLTSRRGHTYDISDARGWKRLAHDMSCMCTMTVPRCKTFVAMLYDHDLISREHHDELGQLAINRVLRDSETYSHGVAKRKLAAYNTNAKRRAKRDGDRDGQQNG
ncbi:MAG: DUF4373 domain-containing protein [Atopobiaceae bacterium]|nr:DUF4373 domain-containing protein [Atopobiaceae bacterium]